MLPRIPSLNIQGSIKRKLESIGGGGEKSSIRSACKRWPVLLGRGSIVEGSVSFFFSWKADFNRCRSSLQKETFNFFCSAGNGQLVALCKWLRKHR